MNYVGTYVKATNNLSVKNFNVKTRSHSWVHRSKLSFFRLPKQHKQNWCDVVTTCPSWAQCRRSYRCPLFSAPRTPIQHASCVHGWWSESMDMCVGNQSGYDWTSNISLGKFIFGATDGAYPKFNVLFVKLPARIALTAILFQFLHHTLIPCRVFTLYTL